MVTFWWVLIIMEVLIVLAAMEVGTVKCNKTIVEAATGEMKGGNDRQDGERSWEEVAQLLLQEAKESSIGTLSMKTQDLFNHLQLFKGDGDNTSTSISKAYKAANEASNMAKEKYQQIKEKTHEAATTVKRCTPSNCQTRVSCS